MKYITIILILCALMVTAYFWHNAESAIHQILAFAAGAFVLILARMAQAEAHREESERLDAARKEAATKRDLQAVSGS